MNSSPLSGRLPALLTGFAPPPRAPRGWHPLSAMLRLAAGGFGRCFRTVPLFRLFGVPVQVHTSWLLFPGGQLAALAREDMLGVKGTLLIAACLLVSLLAHEFAHVLVARGFGYQTRRVVFFPLGAVAVLEDEMDEGAELWIALAGPLMSAGIALAAGLPLLATGMSGWLIYDLHPVAWHLAFINTLLALFNLLPCPPMDGGRVVRAVVALVIGRLRPACASCARLLATRFVVRCISLPVSVVIIGHVLLITQEWSLLVTMLLVIVFGEFECELLRARQREPLLVLNTLFLPADAPLWWPRRARRDVTDGHPDVTDGHRDVTVRRPACPRPLTQPAT